MNGRLHLSFEDHLGRWGVLALDSTRCIQWIKVHGGDTSPGKVHSTSSREPFKALIGYERHSCASTISSGASPSEKTSES